MAITTTEINVRNDDGSGVWAELGSQSSSQNTDLFVTNGGSRAKKVSNSTKGFMFEINASGEDISALVVAMRWQTTNGVDLLAARGSGGVSVAVQDTSGNVSYWDIAGNDTYLGGWTVVIASMATTPSRDSGTAANLALIRYIGMEWTTTGTVGGGDPNCFIDYVATFPIAGVAITGNSTSLLGDLVDVIDIANTNSIVTGLFERRSGQLFSKCRINLQPDASDMSENDESLTFENPVYDTGGSGTGLDSLLDEIGLIGADADNVTLTRCNIISADPDEAVFLDANREFDISAASTDFHLDTCTIRGFDGTGAVALGGSEQAVDNTTFDACGKITAGAAIIRDCFFRRPTDAAGAFFWDENTDMDRCDFFSDGSGYGIHYRPTGAGPFVENLDGFDFTAYGADETADAAVHINPVTTTVTITFNITNASEPTYDEDAGYTGTFTSVPSPVSATVTVLDQRDLSTIEGAIVLVLAADGSGPFPFEESVTISQSGGVATVVHTGHGMDTNDKVLIADASPAAYNGVKTITFVDTNSYTFPIDSGTASPATGTIISTYVALSGLTNASGVITVSRVLSSDQPITGSARKKSSSPVFKDGPITGDFDSVDGFAQIVQLVFDE